MTIQERASELYKGIDWKEITPEIKRVVVTAKYGTTLYDDLMKITFRVSEDTNLHADSVYEFTMDALATIADTEGGEDELREAQYNLEPDVYTSNLTAWLNQSAHHVCYLNEAIGNGATKGFDLLAMAQQAARQEVYSIVLEWIMADVQK